MNLSTVSSLQLVQNIATRLLDNTQRSENVTFKSLQSTLSKREQFIWKAAGELTLLQ